MCRPVIEALEQRVLYHGGTVGSAVDAVSAPAPVSAGPWTVEASAPVQLFEAEGASVNGKLYVFGGFDNSKIQVTDSAEVFDPAGNTWQSLPDTPAPQTHVGTAATRTMRRGAGEMCDSGRGAATSTAIRRISALGRCPLNQGRKWF